MQIPSRALPPSSSSQAYGTWRANGRPEAAAFAEQFAAVRVPSDQVIDLTRLAPSLRWELAYVIQCRHDERTSRTPPEVVARVVAFLLEAGIPSLREGDEQSWREAFAASGRRDTNGRGLIVYAHQRVADLDVGGGWRPSTPARCGSCGGSDTPAISPSPSYTTVQDLTGSAAPATVRPLPLS